MCCEGDDILKASLLKATDNKLGASPTPAEEAALLGKDPQSQETWETTAHPADHPEETPKPKGAARIEWEA